MHINTGQSSTFLVMCIRNAKIKQHIVQGAQRQPFPKEQLVWQAQEGKTESGGMISAFSHTSTLSCSTTALE